MDAVYVRGVEGGCDVKIEIDILTSDDICIGDFVTVISHLPREVQSLGMFGMGVETIVVADRSGMGDAHFVASIERPFVVVYRKPLFSDRDWTTTYDLRQTQLRKISNQFALAVWSDAVVRRDRFLKEAT